MPDSSNPFWTLAAVFVGGVLTLTGTVLAQWLLARQQRRAGTQAAGAQYLASLTELLAFSFAVRVGGYGANGIDFDGMLAIQQRVALAGATLSLSCQPATAQALLTAERTHYAAVRRSNPGDVPDGEWDSLNEACLASHRALEAALRTELGKKPHAIT